MSCRNAEWWLIDGQAVFADGDIGDINHEGYVIQALMSELVEDVNTETGSRIDPEYADTPTLDFEIRKYLDIDPTDMDEDKKVENFIINELGFSREKLDVIQGKVDARDYGMKVLGWKRVHGTSIQTWTLEDKDLKEIADAMYDACQEEAEEFEYEIEVMSNGKFFTGVPWSVLEGDKVADLRPYQHVYARKLNLLRVYGK
jgi:hypothetical protein